MHATAHTPVLLITCLFAIHAVLVLGGCTAARTQPSATATLATGTVTGLSRGHGNVYTSIAPDQYAPLGLEAGRRIRVHFPHTAITLPVGLDYGDVPVGSPVAVLHREGLTFALRDANFSQTHGITIDMPFRITAADK